MVLLRNGRKTEKAPIKQYVSVRDVYKKENKAEFQKKYANPGEAQKALVDKWNSLTDKQKEKYQKIYDEAEKQYEKSLVLFFGGTNKDIKSLQEVEKIPPRPSPPMNAMFRFFNHHRASVAKKNPEMKPAQITEILAEMWEKADAKQRKPFVDEYKKVQIEFHVELDEWKKTYGQKFKEGQRLIVEKHKFHNHEKIGLPYEEILSAKQKKRALVSLSPKRQKSENKEKNERKEKPVRRGGRPKLQQEQHSDTEQQPIVRQDRSPSQGTSGQRGRPPKK